MATAAITPSIQNITSGSGAFTDLIGPVPDNQIYRLDGIVFSNIRSGNVDLKVYLISGQQTIDFTKLVVPNAEIPANTLWTLPVGPLTLTAGFKLVGIASLTESVNSTITGFSQ